MSLMRLLRLLASLSLLSGCVLVGYDLDGAPDASVSAEGDGGAGGSGKEDDVGSGSTEQPDGGGPIVAPPDGSGPDGGSCSGGDAAERRGCACEPETATCDGGVFVVCDAGGRVVSAQDCVAAAGGCEVGSCDAEAGCLIEKRADDTPCDDGLFCTTGEVCSNGVCEGGGDRDCSAKDSQCTLGVCNELLARCMAAPSHEGLACDDGSDCTPTDKCALGLCTGPRMNCTSHDGECKVGVCNDETGACEARPLPAGTSCADGKICGEGLCQTGQACGLGLECAIGCAPATSCLLVCAGAQDCEPGCSAGANCAIDCALTGRCRPTCTTDSTCSVSCGGTSECDVVCDGSTCSIDCSATDNCDQIECLNGSSCVLNCASSPACSFKTCWSDAPASCPNGTIVCGVACG